MMPQRAWVRPGTAGQRSLAVRHQDDRGAVLSSKVAARRGLKRSTDVLKIVYFLGAGFSRHFHLPTMNEFFDTALGSSRIDDGERQFLDGVRLRARQAATFLEGEYANLEHTLSFAETDVRLGVGETGADGVTAYDRLRQILGKVYSAPHKDYWGAFKKFGDLWPKERIKNRTAEAQVITTNYDLNAEGCLRQMGSPAHLPIAWSGMGAGSTVAKGRLYSRSAGGSTPLYKLHGSLNWFENEDNPNALVVDDNIVRTFSEPDEHGNDRPDVDLPLPCSRNPPAGTPIIVPPTFAKDSDDRRLLPNWRGAAAALREADLLVVVGYSFPASDTYMKYFFATCLAPNTRLSRIHLIDPHATQILDRLSKSDLGSHFLELLQPHPMPWNDWKIASALPNR